MKDGVSASTHHGRTILHMVSHKPLPPPTAAGLGEVSERLALALSRAPDRESINPDDPSSAQALTSALIRAAAAELALAVSSKGRNITREQRDAFLVMLSVGMGMKESAAAAGCSPTALHAMRRRDRAFAAAWDDALDISLDAIDRRLMTIALHGKAESMATVRAAEILKRGRARAERRDLAQAQALEVRTNGADGSLSVRYVSATPLPD